MTMALAKQALLWGQRSSRLLPPFQEPPSFCRVPSLAAHPCPPTLGGRRELAEQSWLQGRAWAVWAAGTAGPHFSLHVPESSFL